VVIGTDYTGSCKPNYHKTSTTPQNNMVPSQYYTVWRQINMIPQQYNLV